MFKKIFIVGLLAFTQASHSKSGEKSLAISVKDSKVEWLASKKIGSSHNGLVTIEEGTVTLEKDMIKSGEITMNMQSIETLDIPKSDKNNAKLTDHLKNDDFFAVDKFPKARLVIKNSKKLPNGQYEVMGDLTIKDTTLPVTLPVTVQMTDRDTTASGKLKIDRTKYGIKYGSSNFFKLAADRIINDEFELSFKIVAK